MRRLNFGCGGNKLHGWENFDIEVDISKPLPFPSECASFIFAEHVVEHITPAQAWGFFKECRRVLAKGGIMRIAVPSIVKVASRADIAYLKWLEQAGFGTPHLESAIQNLIVNHGHQALWCSSLFEACFAGLGMDCRTADVGESRHPDLRGLEGHGKVIGDRNNRIETLVVEAIK
jgi:predicted SAM-dependent methyltransferase